MSAENIAVPAEDDVESALDTAYADWGFVMDADAERLLPTLVLGNDRSELHLELTPVVMDGLLSALVAHGQDNGGGEHDDDEETPGRSSLGKRIGTKAFTASGWPTADRWWRSTGSSTRIIVGGVIAAVMVLGLLVTF
ncbi:hypothetical protein [Streptomyces sp. NPDC054865]